MSTVHAWLSPRPITARRIIDSLQLPLLAVTRPISAHRYHCYDSFGSTLWFAGLLLYRNHNTWTLCRCQQLLGDDVLARCVAAEAPVVPRFSWDFPPGELRDLLKSHLKLRAVQPTATFTQREQWLDIHNDDDKIVARLRLHTFFPTAKSRKAFYQVLQIIPLRGYDAEHEAITTQLKTTLLLTQTIPNPTLAYFEYTQQAPTAYNSKLDYSFIASTPARTVLNGMTVEALRVMRINERGIIDDIDTEFLHDYRVALRKVRSLLSQLRGVYPKDFTRQIRAVLARLGQHTNRLRDLDVYLLERDHYFSLSPPLLKRGLESMFEDFANQRTAAHYQLSRYLRGRSYRVAMKKLQQRFVQAEMLPATTYSATPIHVLACRKIRKAYKKVRRDGSKLSTTSPAEEVHQLRIDCKKLRYLLEFFAPSFDTQLINTLIRQLKTLQDCLGRFNDLAVQQTALCNYLADKDQAEPLLHQAIGALLGILHQEQLSIRQQFATHFAKFDDEKTRATFAQLFPKIELLPPPSADTGEGSPT